MPMLAITSVIVALLSLAQPARAAGDLTQQEPIRVAVSLGNGADDRVFEPGDLTFETGKLYKLVLHNPSKVKHYFTSGGFADRVFTRKVQVVDKPEEDAQPIGEIKGSIREIEVYPGGTVEWWFVPVATGKLIDLHCHVKDEDQKTHAEKGMVGTIEIK